MKLRRKQTLKEGSPADASSDRDTEGLSISGSMDVDDLDNDEVDTPTPVKAGDRPAGSAFDDKDTASSQTRSGGELSHGYKDALTTESEEGKSKEDHEEKEISSEVDTNASTEEMKMNEEIKSGQSELEITSARENEGKDEQRALEEPLEEEPVSTRSIIEPPEADAGAAETEKVETDQLPVLKKRKR
ncbi:hypothetical protein R1flu_021149 [Riccia fluitans]|uniref:Uncharacterized protein n=1 Tax=Riccia fluitans TaxID=41844 RepID=A0ABD1ZQ56_9MARC